MNKIVLSVFALAALATATIAPASRAALAQVLQGTACTSPDVTGKFVCGQMFAPSPTPSPTATVTPSPAPSTFFTPTASAAPKLAMSPSPFNKKACSADPCTPVFDKNSAKYNTGWFPGGVVAFPLDDWMIPGHGLAYAGGEEIPVYTAHNTDPSYTLNCANNGCGSYNLTGVHIPNGAHGDASGDLTSGDYLFDVVNVDSNTDSSGFEFNTGSYTVSTPGTLGSVSGGSPNPIWNGGLGQVTDGTCLAGGVNNCMNGSAGGTPESVDELDPVELLQQNIPHTLHLVASCVSSTGFVYPAGGNGDGTGPSICPPTGEKLWLDWTDARIEAATLPRWAKTLYHNLHDYGWFILDAGPYAAGTNAHSLQGVSDFTWTAVGKPSQWTLMYSEMTAEGSVLPIANSGQDYTVQLPVATGLTVSNFHWLRYRDQP